jgi:uncharacterized membrane protein YkvA (DUF1232 family)
MVGNRSRSARSGSPSEAEPAPDRIEGEVIPPTRRRGAARDLDGRKILARFVGVVARAPRYLRLGWLLLQDPTVSGRGKAALGGGLAYAISPIDLVPGFIPVLGQLDDLAILLLAVHIALRSCPSQVAEGHLATVGLTWDTLERDLVTIRATTIWVARRGGALAARAGMAMLGQAGRRLRAALGGSRS